MPQVQETQQLFIITKTLWNVTYGKQRKQKAKPNELGALLVMIQDYFPMR